MAHSGSGATLPPTRPVSSTVYTASYGMPLMTAGRVFGGGLLDQTISGFKNEFGSQIRLVVAILVLENTTLNPSLSN